jgi:hypothetical protein
MANNNNISSNNSSSNSVAKSGKNGEMSVGKFIFAIFAIIFVIVLFYVIYTTIIYINKKNSSNPVIINDVIDADVARPAFNLPEIQMGLNQAFSTWIYVKDFNYKFGEYKNILWKGQTGNGSNNVHSPSIWLYPLTNSLKVVTSTQDVSGVESCDIPNIPLMTWVHIVYVLNNRTVDIYINGKLERSCALRNLPVINSSPVYITMGSPNAGFYGQIGKTQYFTKNLLPTDVMDLYQQGPLGSTQYQIQFFQDGKFISVNNKSSFES